MSDVLCRVCGEPWDTHHLRYDAPAWVMPLVLAGAGCESCEGEAPEGSDADAIAEKSDVSLVIDGAIDTDPATARPAIAGGEVPRWERPVNPAAWACDCGVNIVRDLDWREGNENAFYVETPPGMNYYQVKSLGVHLSNRFDTLENATDEVSFDGTHCRLCAYQCRDCSKVIVEGEDFSAAPPDDPYAANASVCEECFSKLEYEQAVESYSQRGLIEALGYKRGSLVWEWFENRDTLSSRVDFEQADKLGLVEPEGGSVLYMVPNRYVHLIDTPENRKQRARILWSLREVVNG